MEVEMVVVGVGEAGKWEPWTIYGAQSARAVVEMLEMPNNSAVSGVGRMALCL